MAFVFAMDSVQRPGGEVGVSYGNRGGRWQRAGGALESSLLEHRFVHVVLEVDANRIMAKQDRPHFRKQRL